MVVEAGLKWLANVLATMIGWLPDLPVAVTNAMDQIPVAIQSVIGWIAPFSPLIPTGQISTGISLIFGAIGITFTIYLVKKVISYFTGGGGAS